MRFKRRLEEAMQAKHEPVNELFFIEDYIRRLCEITRDCRDDMHEPDEQGLSMKFVEGMGFDNACMNPPDLIPGTELVSDAGFWLIRDEGRPTERREWFNLACLIAIVRTGPWRN